MITLLALLSLSNSRLACTPSLQPASQHDPSTHLPTYLPTYLHVVVAEGGLAQIPKLYSTTAGAVHEGRTLVRVELRRRDDLRQLLHILRL